MLLFDILVCGAVVLDYIIMKYDPTVLSTAEKIIVYRYSYYLLYNVQEISVIPASV